MKQIDRSVKDIFGKLDNLFPDLADTTSTNNNSPPTLADAKNINYNEWLKRNAKDDNYYLERNLDPPRFEIYKIAKELILKNTEESKRRVQGLIKTDEDMANYLPVHDPMTMDEFDYRLKKDLKHTTPEERYQSRKETYYFHDLYRDNGEYGCNPTMRKEICVPECRFYEKTGRFEDEEFIAEHRKAVEMFEKYNAIIEIKIQDDNSFRITRVQKYSSDNNTSQHQQPNGSPD